MLKDYIFRYRFVIIFEGEIPTICPVSLFLTVNQPNHYNGNYSIQTKKKVFFFLTFVFHILKLTLSTS